MSLCRLGFCQSRGGNLALSQSLKSRSLQVVFTLRHSHKVGGRQQKISNQLLLFVHQQLYIAALSSVSPEICCKPPMCESDTTGPRHLILERGSTLMMSCCQRTFVRVAYHPYGPYSCRPERHKRSFFPSEIISFDSNIQNVYFYLMNIFNVFL